MTAVYDHVREMLDRLGDNSQSELEFVRRLSEAVHRVDEQLLREVRSVALQHELRRGAILGELQTLASRLCALPVQSQSRATQAIDQLPYAHNVSGGDWLEAAQKIRDAPDEFEFVFQTPTH
jgi:hypothetical protein